MFFQCDRMISKEPKSHVSNYTGVDSFAVDQTTKIDMQPHYELIRSLSKERSNINRIDRRFYELYQDEDSENDKLDKLYLDFIKEVWRLSKKVVIHKMAKLFNVDRYALSS
ncbi:28467_t:CDS:2 [Racocetra persica]|uniref:28467_t:CDS:1 n=1 Tax=Racocetra persica TaxID=160502 RepID=A0ACA9LKB6_9GLOM|nr:28467_t:CDS:2 [Racocetra persica]